MYQIKLKKPIWVIGDIHGQYEKLLLLISNIKKQDPDPTICFVGDLIDRGSQPIEVIKLIQKNNYYCVLGNHEVMMAHPDNYPESNYRIGWIHNGGDLTLTAYEGKDKLFQDHIQWFKELPVVINFNLKGEKPLFVSHSGFNIDKLDNFDPDFVIWNKKGYYPVSEKGINIFGHMITNTDRAFLSDSHICIDSGGYKDLNTERGRGFLTAMQYPSLNRVYSL